MAKELGSYLNNLGRQLRLDAVRQGEILAELGAHIEDRVRELQGRGISHEEALEQAIDELGNPKEVAGGMYSVHSIGSWREVVLASLPHVLLAFLFALHLWSRIIWIVLLLTLSTFVTLQAWRSGKPKWTYPWLGYAIAAPAISWILALASLGYGGWMFFTQGTLPLGIPLYIAILVYLPISLWLVLRIATRLVRQDWLLVSLAALPLPFLASWFFFVHWRGGLLTSSAQRVEEHASDAALVFLALAVTTAIFFKVGQRSLRIALLVVTAPILAALAALAYQSNPNSLPVLLVAFATVVFLISPVLLDTRTTRQEQYQPRPLSEKLH